MAAKVVGLMKVKAVHTAHRVDLSQGLLIINTGSLTRSILSDPLHILEILAWVFADDAHGSPGRNRRKWDFVLFRRRSGSWGSRRLIRGHSSRGRSCKGNERFLTAIHKVLIRKIPNQGLKACLLKVCLLNFRNSSPVEARLDCRLRRFLKPPISGRFSFCGGGGEDERVKAAFSSTFGRRFNGFWVGVATRLPPSPSDLEIRWFGGLRKICRRSFWSKKNFGKEDFLAKIFVGRISFRCHHVIRFIPWVSTARIGEVNGGWFLLRDTVIPRISPVWS